MKVTDSVQYVKGVGPRMAQLLLRLGITTVEDLISFFPRAYQDWTQVTKMEDMVPDGTCVVYGRVAGLKEVHPRRTMSILNVVLTDGTGAVTLTWFNQPWKGEGLTQGMHLLAYGKCEYGYGRWQIQNPETEAVEPADLPHFQKLVPIYPLTEGISIQRMRKMIAYALDHVEGLTENLPEDVVKREHLMDRLTAIRTMHHPVSGEEQQAARRRIAFEELFFMQAGVLLLRKARGREGGIKCAPSGKLVRAVLDHFPFTLTEGQREAFTDIENDMEGLTPMNRLVQGDVGSGKTAVAALALAKIVENGYQGALMAPTEVLAEQHYETFQKFYEGLPIHVGFLTGEVKGKARKEVLAGLSDGSVDVLIGTHALLGDQVSFAHLGLVITDEQHRFGVKQREALEKKGTAPHRLVMTATPIPRSMALTYYGDLDVSSIHSMPPGRKPVKTSYPIDSSYLQKAYQFLGRQMEAGHQVYVVCPLVEESEKADLASAESVYENFRDRIFPMFHVGLVHGRMKNAEKEEIMRDFHDGKIQLLVSTTVIEVGVNVPNATVMFVYGADRFGLSQLHQLRGRVGRGNAQSYCILYTDNHTEEVRTRLTLLHDISDGFLLSEKDLLMRGSGEFFGTHQSGVTDLKVADVVRDFPLLKEARSAAEKAVADGFDFSEELSHRFGGKFAAAAEK